MTLKSISFLIMLVLVPGVVPAEDKDLQARVDEVNDRIKTEQEANQKLKDDITARDREIAELKQRLKELETKTAATGK